MPVCSLTISAFDALAGGGEGLFRRSRQELGGSRSSPSMMSAAIPDERARPLWEVASSIVDIRGRPVVRVRTHRRR
jgi:hypothetical protein